MATKNIFSSIGIVGFCEKWESTIMSYSGISGTPIQLFYSGYLKRQHVFNADLSDKFNSWIGQPCEIYLTEHRLRDYVGLTSSKSAIIGYEFLSGDVETRTVGGVQKHFSTTTNDFSIEAKNGGEIVWWENAITSNSTIQCVVIRMTSVGSQSPLSAIKNPLIKNVQFKYSVTAEGECYNYSYT